jgi:hypothetical protein
MAALLALSAFGPRCRAMEQATLAVSPDHAPEVVDARASATLFCSRAARRARRAPDRRRAASPASLAASARSAQADRRRSSPTSRSSTRSRAQEPVRPELRRRGVKNLARSRRRRDRRARRVPKLDELAALVGMPPPRCCRTSPHGARIAQRAASPTSSIAAATRLPALPPREVLQMDKQEVKQELKQQELRRDQGRPADAGRWSSRALA